MFLIQNNIPFKLLKTETIASNIDNLSVEINLRKKN